MNSTPEAGPTEVEPTEIEQAEVEQTEPELTEPEPADLEPDPELLGARDLALAALREITDEKTIGAPAGYLQEPDGALSLRFANRLEGYPGWFWTVTLARVAGSAPTVLETELMPGDGALLAPEWTPWAERLAEYQAHQAELDQEAALAAEASGEDNESDEDEDDAEDIDDLDAADFDEDGSPILHSGDVDGVDIDNFAEDDESEDDESEEDEDDSDDDESDDEDDEDDESEDDDEFDYQDPRVDRSY